MRLKKTLALAALLVGLAAAPQASAHGPWFPPDDGSTGSSEVCYAYPDLTWYSWFIGLFY